MIRISGGRGLAAAATLAVIAATAPAASARPPRDDFPPATKPVINMSRVLLAAQIDPGRPGTGLTFRAKRSVLRVERRLHRHGLLARSFIDGHFGTTTKEAYTRWQQRLGYSGLAANGLPGRASLTRLAGDRFTVVRKVNVGPRLTLPGGSVLNRRTNRMKMAAANRLGGCRFVVSQGSYIAGGVDASAGTHDGGGAVDLDVTRGCGARPRAVRALRLVGFAAWFRPTIPGLWSKHIHAIAVNDTDLSSGAAAQVSEYYRGYDGLSGDGLDRGPKVKKTTWEIYKRTH